MNMKQKGIFLFAAVLLLLLAGCGAGRSGDAISAENVSDQVAQAEALYAQEAYTESLELYLDAMQRNPKDMTARMGVVRCQIALENYEMASRNLSAAVDISPNTPEIYDLYIELSELTGWIGYARSAVSLADNYNQEDFLARVPEEPTIVVKGGVYDSSLQVEIVNNDPEVAVYYSLANSNYNLYVTDAAYSAPITVVTGNTTLTAYSVKDGVPSHNVSASYQCAYPASAVTFEDPVMELIVRGALDKPEGEITNLECEQLTYLNSYSLQSVVSDYNEANSLRVHTLNDLQKFPSLTYISFYNQDEIYDYSGLACCTNLTQLYLQGCNLNDLSLLQYAPNVMHLQVSDNSIKSLNGIDRLKTLYSLDVHGNPIEDFSALAECGSMNTLSFNASAGANAIPFENMTNLYSITLYGWENFDFNRLAALTSLEQLSVGFSSFDDYYNPPVLDDLSFLQNLPGLMYLDLSGVEDAGQLEYVKGLEQLQWLYLYNCPVSRNDAAMQDLRTALPYCAIYG